MTDYPAESTVTAAPPPRPRHSDCLRVRLLPFLLYHTYTSTVLTSLAKDRIVVMARSPTAYMHMYMLHVHVYMLYMYMYMYMYNVMHVYMTG